MDFFVESIYNLIILSFYMFDFKIKLTQEFQPSSFPSIYDWLIEQIF